MKQLDTIRNHEWIPTEFDLENMPRVTMQLPTASAENFGIVYLLDGSQDGYVKSHFYKCAQDSETGLYYWMDLHVGRFSVGNCKNIRISMYDDGTQLRVIMAWEDPDDVIVGSEITHWKKTVLVHQVGHMPLTVNDGTVLCTNESRNAYAAFGSFSMTLQDNSARKHYFKLFPYSDDDAITNDDQNGRVAGFNYIITSDAHPYTLDTEGQPVYRDYYFRMLDTETGLYKYELVDPNNTDNWTIGDAGFREFKKGVPYYAYQNCLLNWAGIKELVQNGIAEDYFPIGTILTLPYHGDYGDMAFEVVDFDNVEPYDSKVKFTMTLQSKYLYSWWDHYGVGYVFDTNERAGAATRDSVRDLNRVYFACIKLNTTEYTATTPHKEVYAQEQAYNHYVETVFDANRENDEYGSASSETYGVASLTWGKWSVTNAPCECELPYTTVYRNPFVEATRVVPGGTSIQYGGNVICSDLRRSTGSADFIVTKDVVYQPNKTYYSNDTGTVKTVVVGDAVSGTVYESASKVCAIQALYSASTGSNKYYSKTNPTGKNGMYNPEALEAVTDAWGAGCRRTGKGANCIDDGTMNLGSCTPRANHLADYFMPVRKVKDTKDLIFGTSYSSLIKYFVPAETLISKHVVDAAASKQTNYVTEYRVYMRDCSDDLRNIYACIFGNRNATAEVKAKCQQYVDGDYSISTTPNMNLSKVCGADPTLEPLLKMPTQDETFVAGKVYWLATWVACGSSQKSEPGVFYYERLGGGSNETTVGDYSDPYVYRRVRVAHNASVSGYYTPSWIKMDFTSATSVTITSAQSATYAGTYSVGDLVPIRAGQGYFVAKKKTANDYVWTMGALDASGEYIPITKDIFGATPSWASGSTYSPSKSAASSAGSGSNFCFRTTDVFEGPIQNVNGNFRVWLFNKTPNLERVAYGNHVWCQSNVRCYLNGPFDTSKEYVETADVNFVTSRVYYKFVSGGYVRLTETSTSGAVDSNHWLKNTSIKDWSIAHNGKQPVYTKIDGGVPVGVKLDLNQPSKYWNYGASPVMQYKYENGNWVPVFTEGDQWWTEQPSVNNGLKYDQLAEMYKMVYIDKGVAGNSTYMLTGAIKNKSPYTNETNIADTNQGWASGIVLVEGTKSGTTTGVTVTTRQRTPRQSFLHGFIDCQYKRSADMSPVEGKTYFKRNLYGRYEEVTNIGTNKPYACGLYEVNPNYKTDLQDAYDFLNAIVPVVNRNGLYGTTGAFDFYPRAGVKEGNLGGTVSVDKVWLMSTNQIVGGDAANNGVYEEWSGEANGRWITFGVADENRYGIPYQEGHKYGLKKWAMCNKNFAVFGATSLNDSRIKYSLTLGQHLANGYSDSTTAAQYWWLRSAGGEIWSYNSAQTPADTQKVPSNGTMSSIGYSHKQYPIGMAENLIWNKHRLSPLITIG
jgi:hypothetical protein